MDGDLGQRYFIEGKIADRDAITPFGFARERIVAVRFVRNARAKNLISYGRVIDRRADRAKHPDGRRIIFQLGKIEP